MPEFVGVKSYWDIVTDFRSPKREALMFNRVAIPDFERLLRMLRHAKSPRKDLIHELEWLGENGFVFVPEDVKPDERLMKDNLFRIFYELEQQFHDKVNYFQERRRKNNFPQSVDEDLKELFRNEMHISFCRVNRISFQLRKLNNLDAYPLLPSISEIIQSPTAPKNDTVQIVIEALPIPDNSTSWEQIVEYRSDPDSHNKFLDLRNWMNEVARAELTPIEIEQKLEYLMSQYQRHMELHKMKTNAGTLETYLTIGAEFLEDLLHFRPSKAVKALFSLKHRQIALIEGELTSPGSEVAYVIKAKETFSG